MKIEIEVDDDFLNKMINGYKLIRIGIPKKGEYFLFFDVVMLCEESTIFGSLKYCCVLEKIEKKRIIFEETGEYRNAKKGEFIELGDGSMYYQDHTTNNKYNVYNRIE